MNKCEACSFISQPQDVINEASHWLVVLSEDQRYLGRSVVFAKRHIQTVSDISKEEWVELHEVMKEFESHMQKSFSATMFNWSCLMNDAYKADEPAPHVHWHVRPRYQAPVEVDGVIFNDTEFAHHYSRDPFEMLSDDMYASILNKATF